VRRIGRTTVQGQLLQLAIEQAVKALRDERFRQQVRSTGEVLAERVRAAYLDRAGKGPILHGPGPGEPSLWDRAVAPFGHDRLVARIATLRDAVDQLRRSAGPAGAVTLAEVDTAVSRIEVAVAASRHLPLLDRQRAHLQVARQLSALEQAVFDAAMAGPPPPQLGG
jgi:hypothetical protein